MNRDIVVVAVSTALFLFGFGCQQQKAVAPPPAVTAEPQPAQARVMVEPNVPAEPNIQQTRVIEPPPKQPAESNAAKPQAAPASPASASELCDRCTEFLSRYVNQQGMVDYRAIARRKPELATLLDRFKTLDQSEYNSWSKEDKIAFWINGYNLEFIKIILDNYPIESTRVLRLFWPPNSIRHIKGLWNEHKFIIMNEEFTLKEADERFFQKEFDEPRVVFAIFYGSISGTPSRNEAYCGDKLSAQLDDQVRKFLAGPHAFKIDRENKVVYLSSLLQSTWYGQQFVAKYGTDRKFKQQDASTKAVLNFLTKYLPPQDVGFLETSNYTVQYMGYDWTLNERAGQ